MQGIDIEEEPDGSLLTVNNLQIEDDGIIECIAVNSVGKAIASTRLLGRIKNFRIRCTSWSDAGSRIIEYKSRGFDFFLHIAAAGGPNPWDSAPPNPFPNPVGQS